MFVDRVVLQLSAGKGGNGVIAWRREKYIPKGGPAGGDGGNGGSIILIAEPQSHSLEDFRNRRLLKAQNGVQGGSNCCKGKNGQDLVLKVPLGTLVKDVASGQVLFDFTTEGQAWVACQGGRGGKGNNRFKTSTHQAPFHCTEGTPGEMREVELELKLIADVGLVGMPNAGKSTLISGMAHIAVKIAPYPFTTLRPNIGLIEFDDYSRLLIADIPGIIDKASQDRGLGLSFLKHIERTSVLVFLIELAPNQDRDPYEEFMLLRRELAAYDPALLEKPSLVVLNKIDQEGTEELASSFKRQYGDIPLVTQKLAAGPSQLLSHERYRTLFEISALQGTGVEKLKYALKNVVAQSGLKELALLPE